jgi:hypothetical protein
MSDYMRKQSNIGRAQERAPDMSPPPGKRTLVEQSYDPAMAVQQRSTDNGSKRLQRGLIALGPPVLAAASLVLGLGDARGGNKITTESVNAYGVGTCPGPPLGNSIANGDGFRNGMLPAGTIWAAGARYTDSSVYDTDFFDPQITSNASDNDTNNFDRSGDAIAYFTGHGVCNPISGATNVSCTHNSQCNSPPAGASLPGNCKSAPGFPGAPAQGPVPLQGRSPSLHLRRRRPARS